MLRKMLIIGVELPYAVYYLYKIRERDYMYKSYVIKLISRN
jgi:hypothetical protein